MAQYEYECSFCGKKITLIQKYDDPSPICPCKDGDPEQMRRILSKGGGFVLKGKCWYKDGYSR